MQFKLVVQGSIVILRPYLNTYPQNKHYIPPDMIICILPLKPPGGEKKNPSQSLINPLNITTHQQEIQETEEHIKQHHRMQ